MKQVTNMNIQKEIYQQPQAEIFELNHGLSFLIGFSLGGEIEGIEDGGDWDDNI